MLETSIRQQPTFAWRRWALLAGMAVVIFLVVLTFFPLGNDYYYYYRPLAEQWLRGDHTMYDGLNQRLFYPPWTLFIILPLGVPSLEAGSAVLTTASLMCLLLALYVLRRLQPIPRYGLVLALVNLSVVDLIIHGQLDMFTLAGMVLGWWAVEKRNPLLLGAGFCLMSMKPVNIVLPVLVFLIAIRKWSWRDIGLVFTAPLLMLAASSALVGFDWPLKYVANYHDPVSKFAISIWRGMAVLNLPTWLPAIPGVVALLAFLRRAWREGLTEWTLGIAIATNLAFTPYAHGHYYVALIPAFLSVSRRDWRWAVLAWAADLGTTAALAVWAGSIVGERAVSADTIGCPVVAASEINHRDTEGTEISIDAIQTFIFTCCVVGSGAFFDSPHPRR